MSTYNWERGTIKLPSNQWVAFRKGILQHYNGHMTARFQLATLVHSKVEAAIKGKRGSVRRNARADAIEKALEGVDYDDRWPVERVLSEGDKLLRPKKKDFPLLPFSKGAMLQCGELTVDLDDKTRSINWNVEENNHAVESAHKSWLGSFVMRKLRGIDWKRDSGGYFKGNDEYSREESEDGANYITNSFGPRGKKERERKMGY
jgi:hypothetical protein